MQPARQGKASVKAGTAGPIRGQTESSFHPPSTSLAFPDMEAENTLRPAGSATGTLRSDGSATDTLRPADSATGTLRPAGSATGTLRSDGSATDTLRSASSATDTLRPAGSANDATRPAGSPTDATPPTGSARDATRPAGHAMESTRLASGATRSAVTAGTEADDTRRPTGSLTRPAQVSAVASGTFSVTAPRYSGEGSFARFTADLNAFGVLNGFSDDQKLRFLPFCLCGVARDAFESIPPGSKDNFDLAITSLQGFFHRPDALDAHGKLRSLRYDPLQPLDNFVIHLRQLVSEAFPGSTSDVVLFNSFLSALPDRFQRDIVSTGTTAFDDAVTKVKNLIRAEQWAQQRVRDVPVREVSVAESKLDALVDRISRLEACLSQGQSQNSAAARSQRPRGNGAARESPPTSPRQCRSCGGYHRGVCRFRNKTCFACGEVGHIRSACSRAVNGGGAPQIK